MTTDPALGLIPHFKQYQRPRLHHPTTQTPRFGQVFVADAAPIKHAVFSKKLFETLEKPKLKRWVIGEANWLNMDVNDWLSRSMTFLMYIFQGVTSLKKDQHKWETNGRNIVIWTGTFAITQSVKSDRIGINPLLNTFMRPKGTPYQDLTHDLALTKDYRKEVLEGIDKLKPSAATDKEAAKKLRKQDKLLKRLTAKETKIENKIGKLVQRHGSETAAAKHVGDWRHKLINKVRLEQNYYDIIQSKHIGTRVGKSDYRKTYWASMDYINLETILDRIQQLKKTQTLNKLAAHETKELKTLSRFMTQLSTFKLLSTAIQSALTIYIIGTVLMNLVFKYIAPKDHDFNPEKTPQAIKKRMEEEKRRQEQNLPLEPHQPATNDFSPFKLPGKAIFGHSPNATQHGGLF